MTPAVLLSPQAWAEQTFGTVQLGDQRRRRRAVALATAMAHDPAASLPAQLHSEAAVHAAYRFLQTPQISYEQLVRPHVQQTREAMGQAKRVLLLQDTTEVDFQQHPKTKRLGPIGNGSHHGFLLQTVLAVLPQSRLVLGIAQQEPFLRQPAPEGETKRERAQRERESQVWERSVQAIGSPPEGVQWIHVGDRYADMFPFLTLCRQLGCDFVVRAAQDRRVDLLVEQVEAKVPKRSHHRQVPTEAAAAGQEHLFEVVTRWPAQDGCELKLESTQQRPTRTANVLISWGCLRLLPPANQEANPQAHPLVVWVVRVWEPEPPEGVEALSWLLLTSVPVESVEQAWERVEWYRARWTIEDYHQGLKTGCHLEQQHLHSYEDLRRLLGLIAPAAVRLLQLRAAARQEPEQPATEVLPPDVVQVVATFAQVPSTELTAQRAWHTIARYGGYLGRRGDGPPGWKTLWKGWSYLQAVLDGVHLAARLSLDLSSGP